jgi:cytochrome c biogenesis protein CcmG, thiol:disulfide interchange protein DsbE
MSSAARGQWVAVGVIVAVLVGALGVGVLVSDDVVRVEEGARAPSFSAVDLGTGAEVNLADYKGEVILLNLWATWCTPCRVEMPAIERLYKELGPEGLKILAVSVDAGDPDQVLEFANSLELTFDILHDATQRIELAYQTTGLPESFIIDRNGVIAHWTIGAEVWDSPTQIARLRRLLQTH